MRPFRQPGETQALEVNDLDAVADMLLLDGAVPVEAALLPADQLSEAAMPLFNGELPAELVLLPPNAYLGAVDELLPSGTVPGDAELLDLLKGLMSKKQGRWWTGFLEGEI